MVKVIIMVMLIFGGGGVRCLRPDERTLVESVDSWVCSSCVAREEFGELSQLSV
jgi:hypothetical protein